MTLHQTSGMAEEVANINRCNLSIVVLDRSETKYKK